MQADITNGANKWKNRAEIYVYRPLQQTTADNVSLSVAVTASVDEFMQPSRQPDNSPQDRRLSGH
jgi:hypothetical protein